MVVSRYQVITSVSREETKLARNASLQVLMPEWRVSGVLLNLVVTFIYRVHPETNKSMLRKHLEDHNVYIRSLDCVSNANSMFKSFKLTTTVSHFRNLFSEDMWPTGVRVRKFIPPRQADHDPPPTCMKKRGTHDRSLK